MSVADLLVVWLGPVALALMAWLLLSLVVWVLVRSRLEFDFGYDLRRKFEMKRRLRSGAGMKLSYVYVAKLLLADNCVQAAFLYRVSRWFVAHRLGAAAEGLHAVAKVITHLDVSPSAEIGRGVYFYHGLGTVIGKGSRIGERALICHGVTTGGRRGAPTIGDDVSLWAGAVVIGRITVGDRVEVGANAVVVKDVPSDSVAVGVPARVVSRSADAPALDAKRTALS